MGREVERGGIRQEKGVQVERQKKKEEGQRGQQRMKIEKEKTRWEQKG